jgi:hypothetical protein
VEWRGRIGPTDEVALDQAADMLGVAPGTVVALVEVGDLSARSNGPITHISLAGLEVDRLRATVAISSADPPASVVPRPLSTSADRAGGAQADTGADGV